MDQRVSPVTTVWLAGSCPSWKAAAGGGTCDVSCAAFELSARAWVVSWATSGGATTPASSPATRASRAARSERQIVVLLIQRLRERVERLRLALGRHLGRGLLLLLPTLPRPLAAGRQGEIRHPGAVVRAPHLGIGP